MKAECTKDKLQQIISRTEKVTGKNLTLTILSCLLLEVKNNTLKLKATNTDLGIESTITIKTIKFGLKSWLFLDAKKFKNLKDS